MISLRSARAPASQKTSIRSEGEVRFRGGEVLAFGECLEPRQHLLVADEGAACVGLGDALANDRGFQLVRGQGALEVSMTSADAKREQDQSTLPNLPP